jgi:hypothetical protein
MPLDYVRPRVDLTTKNLIDELRRRADVRTPALAAIPGVVGITLNGGLSRTATTSRRSI